MDILSHGLWAAAVARGGESGKPREVKKLSFWKLVFFGMFPDLFAFVPIFFWSFILMITGGETLIHRPPTELEPWAPGFESLSNVTQLLYQLSHSLVILAVVILAYYLWKRKIPWIILGWPLHILSDIPTHSYDFYPTPALWPLFDWKFNGFSWGSGHFTLYNFIALILVYLGLYFLSKRYAKQYDT